MTAQTQKVDVLGVMDDLHRGCRLYCDSEGRDKRSNYANDLIEVRSPAAKHAMAEVIEALRGFVKLAEERKRELGELSPEMEDRLVCGVAALAALAGGAA